MYRLISVVIFRGTGNGQEWTWCCSRMDIRVQCLVSACSSSWYVLYIFVWFSFGLLSTCVTMGWIFEISYVRIQFNSIQIVVPIYNKSYFFPLIHNLFPAKLLGFAKYVRERIWAILYWPLRIKSRNKLGPLRIDTILNGQPLTETEDFRNLGWNVLWG